MLGNDGKLIHKTLRESIGEIIRKKILTGELKPGERIVELDIANELGVSRGPIREAMRQIEQEGLIQYSTNKGCNVVLLSPEDAWEILFLRSSLEKMAIQLCKGIVSDDVLKELESILIHIKAAEDSKDLTALYSFDEKFHGLIICLGEMKHLFKLWDSLQGLSIALFLIKDNPISNMKNQYTRHKKLLESLRSNNVDIINDAIDRHYLDTKELLFSV